MKTLVRSILLTSLVLLVPIVPFLLFDTPLAERIEHWTEMVSAAPDDHGHLPAQPARSVVAAAVVGLLAVDILLPIPSSVVGTLAGSQLGVVAGTAATWLGLTLGSVAAFAMARRWGRPLALRFCAAADLDRMEAVGDRCGPLAIVAFRAVPVLAEASVLLLGLHRLSWRRFVLPLSAGNLGIALAYAALGHVATEQHWLAPALAVSAALPLLLVGVVKRLLPKETRDTNDSVNQAAQRLP